MTIEEKAQQIIARWRPYMKVFGPSEGFPKNKISMQEDIAAALRSCYEEAAEIAEDHNGCINPECFKRNCPVCIADEIRKLAE